MKVYKSFKMEAFESKGLKVNLKKTKVIVSGSKDEILKIEVDPCAKCSKTVYHCSDRVTFALMPTPRAFVFVYCYPVFSFHFRRNVSHAFLRLSKVIM